MAAEVVETDPVTRQEIGEALTNLARYAAHQQHHPDCERWVTAHRRMDYLLTEWELAPA